MVGAAARFIGAILKVLINVPLKNDNATRQLPTLRDVARLSRDTTTLAIDSASRVENSVGVENLDVRSSLLTRVISSKIPRSDIALALSITHRNTWIVLPPPSLAATRGSRPITDMRQHLLLRASSRRNDEARCPTVLLSPPSLFPGDSCDRIC